MTRRVLLVFLLLGLTSGSEEEKCQETEECVAPGKCEEFQTDRKKLKGLNKSSQEYNELLSELKQKVCNRTPNKVCCSCPCKARDQCPYVEQLYQVNDISKLKSLVCSRSEKTFFCCDNTPPQEPPKIQVSTKPDDPSSDPSWLPDPENEDCGLDDSPPTRVVGGVDTEPGEYPYTALIGSIKDEKVLWKCGGTLINRWYVLTAAHCHGAGSRAITRVRLGEWSVKDKVDCLKTKQCEKSGDCFCLNPVQDFNIGPNQVIVHENWEGRSPYLNDIALVKLDRAVQLEVGVKLACLPSDQDLAEEHLNVRDLSPNSGLAGKYGIVVGWGYTEYDPYRGGAQGDIKEARVANNIQQKLEIPVIPTEECSRMFRGSITPHETQICAGGERGKDSCKGDSGGPLYFKTIAGTGNRPAKSSINPTYLLGIVSFGSKNCGSGTPGIYTNVKDFIPWIKQTIRANN